jgi:hypothetical protein
MPSFAKMKNHSFAVTAVGIAHGMRTLARRSPRPRKLPFMIIANQNPSTSSMDTVTTVKNTVIHTLPQKLAAFVPGAHAASPQRCSSQWM